MGAIVKVDNIKKTFILSSKQMKINNSKDKIKIAVNELSFEVEKGDIYGLLGSNGAGKTTTLRMLAGLIKSESGSILINDIDINKEPNKIKENIAFLTTDLKLDPFFTPSYLFDFYADLRKLTKEFKDERKKELFNKFGINEFSEVKISELSTGMQQKAALAISLLHDPDIIIFDEPTNGLDVLTAKVVTDYILELKAKNKTIILSTHIFSLIEKVCNKVGIIINGHMVKDGLITNITKEKNLEDVFFDLYKENVREV
ncbi:MAG: ABC transporter ATP-binding protein [Acholeplasmatales bacterium]|jgi:sodium transport system ATP-binding protein|nr:ABC transporter ATP-binding protein [Acholeplasmatales bacterium]